MSKRYFINNLDGLIGNEIIKELTKGDEEIEPVHMGTYLEQTRLDKGRGVKKILKRYKPKLARKKMLEECDVYIYDMHSMINETNKQDYSDIKYVNEVCLSTQMEEQKVLILVSDVRAWSNTPKKIKEVVPEVKEGEGEGEGEGEENQDNQEEQQEEENQQENEQEDEEDNEDEDGEGDGEGDGEQKKEEDQKPQEEEQEEEEAPIEYAPYNENDYQSRVPKDKYKKMKRMEDLILQLQGRENLKVLVVCSGVLYGEGEVVLRNHFKSAWLQNPQKLPYIGEGDNLVPTIHVKDLARFVIKVAENPPENSYLFAIDNSQDRSQKALIQAISNGVGSSQIESVEKTDLVDQHQLDIFTLDLDFLPNPLMVSNDPENPAEFEWHSEKGLITNTRKVLEEFWKAHQLRPLKILMVTPENERAEEWSQFDWTTLEISKHYRIPILKIEEIIKDIAENMRDNILGDDVREEQENLAEYLKLKGEVRPLDETMKVLYRVMKWRLNQNDCMNRGFILDNYPLNNEELSYIFYPQKGKKLDRIRPKPKKFKRRKRKTQEEQEQQQKQEDDNNNNEDKDGEEQDEEDQENKSQEGEAEQDQEQPQENNPDQDQEGEDGQPQEEEIFLEGEFDENDEEWEYYEIEEKKKVREDGEEGEEEEEEQPAEEEPQEEEEGEDGAPAAPKVEFFFPESYIFIKRLERIKKDVSPQSEVLDYFSLQGNEIMVFDAYKKAKFEIFESLRIYIERNKRPYNYLQPENELKTYHDEFYDKRDTQNKEKKEELLVKLNVEQEKKKLEREKVCQEQIQYVLENEGEIEEIKKMPFRNYLLEYVVPELNDGLVEVSNFLPDDPVEFLAEYLYEKSFEFSN